MTDTPAQSPGHIAFVGDAEYYDLDGQVYRASLSNEFDFRTGVRFGRWESSRAHWDHYDRLTVLRQWEDQA